MMTNKVLGKFVLVFVALLVRCFVDAEISSFQQTSSAAAAEDRAANVRQSYPWTIADFVDLRDIRDFNRWTETSGVEVLTGDFNGDGKTDVALVGDENWSTIPLAISNGDGNFTIVHYNATQDVNRRAGSSDVEVLTGDFNGDGATDVALVDIATVTVAISNGNGSFNVTDHDAPEINGWIRLGAQVLTGDFNGDGNTDLAWIGGENWKMTPVLFSRGDGRFVATREMVANPQDNPNSLARESGVKLLTGDFNGDGKTDVALLGGSSWITAPVATSIGDGRFAVNNKEIVNMNTFARESGVKVLTGDFNGDGKTDKALIGASGWKSVPVATSNGIGSFAVTNERVANINYWYSCCGATVLTGDFNGDGKTDIALIGGTGWQTIPVFFSSGSGKFTVTNERAERINEYSRFKGAKVLTGDFDGDGKTDIAYVGGETWATIPVAFPSF